ncbi:hypothetical protein N9Y42_07710 [Mariniblastus sp.]|nr:hypothetical protein [Mariniblastus sp.]
MSISISSAWSLLLSIAFLVVAPAQATFAQIDRELEFKIDTKMFLEDSKESSFNTKTIFSEGLIFDFPLAAGNKSPDEILVYDSNLKTISLLDLKRQMQLKLMDVQLKKMTEAIRQQMSTEDRTRMLVEQTFEEKINPDENSLVLVGDQKITYRMHGTAPESPKVMSAYFEFLDVFTRVQITDPKKLPPFARFRLNKSIRQLGWIPDRVDISVGKSELFPEPFKARTEHKLTMQVTDRDRSEIALAKKSWAALPEVSLAKYRGIPEHKNFFSRVADEAKKNAAKPTE